MSEPTNNFKVTVAGTASPVPADEVKKMQQMVREGRMELAPGAAEELAAMGLSMDQLKSLLLGGGTGGLDS